MVEEEKLFPVIGEIVEKADNAPEIETNDTLEPENDDDRPVQEIESLCLNCGENVNEALISVCMGRGLTSIAEGNNPTALDVNTIFSRNHHHVLPLRTLWV